MHSRWLPHDAGWGEWRISACVDPTVKHGGGGGIVWGCSAGNTVCDLFRIKAHLTSCVRAIWPRRRVMECCIRWPGLHNHPTSTQLRWFGISWTAEWRKCSQQLLSICGNSFKTVGKAFQVNLVERMPRVYKARQREATLKNLKYKIYFELFNTFLVTPICAIS